MNTNKSRMKSFIGGAVIFGIIGAITGGIVMSVILGTAFIDYSLSHPTLCQTIHK